jgi:hypothetical protein
VSHGADGLQFLECAEHRRERSMPFKSKAQRRKFAHLLVEGKISDETFEEWNKETGKKTLPERVTPKAKRATKRTATGKRRAAKKR